MPFAAADVDHRRAVPPDQRDRRPGDVAGVDVVADRRPAAVEVDRLAVLDPVQEGDDGALAAVRVLVLAVDRGAAQDPRLQPVLAARRQHLVLAVEVEAAVGAEGLRSGRPRGRGSSPARRRRCRRRRGR